MSFLLELFDEFFILEAPVIKRLFEIFSVNFLKVRKLVIFLCDQILQLVAEAKAKHTEPLFLEWLRVNDLKQEGLAFFLPIVHKGLQLVLREGIPSCNWWIHLDVEIISLLFGLHNLLAFLKHFYLSVQAIHVVFVSKNHILVLVSDFEFEILRSHWEGKIFVVQILSKEHSILWVHLSWAYR